MIGESTEFLKVVAAIEKIACYDVPTLIEGETGTGKELVARAVHYRSGRKDRPFVPVNCGALPETLIENELFGHRRGAFTDAREDQLGLVALADGGTLFLDEVDALPLKGQVTLLRFLQDQLYRPVGEKTEARADVRVIAASNRELSALCEAGQFRLDLMYRLRFFNLRLPPLRERRGDADLLAKHFVAMAAERFHKRPRPIARETLAWFDRHSWPGNVRELENLVYREFLLREGDVLSIPAPTGAGDAAEEARTAGVLCYREAKARAIAAFERAYLVDIMQRAAGNVSEAARIIGTERRHLGRLLKKHGISGGNPAVE